MNANRQLCYIVRKEGRIPIGIESVILIKELPKRHNIIAVQGVDKIEKKIIATKYLFLTLDDAKAHARAGLRNLLNHLYNVFGISDDYLNEDLLLSAINESAVGAIITLRALINNINALDEQKFQRGA